MADSKVNGDAAKGTLDEQLASKRAELIETKRSHAAGELVNPRALGRIRKEIARIHTELNSKKEDTPQKGATV